LGSSSALKDLQTLIAAMYIQSEQVELVPAKLMLWVDALQHPLQIK